ncbi:MAG: ABC transporter ATP-binding protein [bacterium]|nr:ABC transporter ATP-binding protein [bacterium]
MKNLKKLYQIMKPLKWVIILLSFLAILESVLGVVTPLVYKVIVNNITNIVSGALTKDAGIRNMIYVTILLLLIFAVTTISYILKSYYGPKLEVQTQRLIRERIFNHLTELSVDFYEKERVGSLMSKFNRGISRGSSLMSQIVNWLASQLLTGIFSMVMIFVIDWQAGLIVLGCTFIYLFNTSRLVKKVNPLHKAINKKYDSISGQIFEVASGIHTVKSFAQEDNETLSFVKRNSSWVDMSLERAKKRAVYVLGRHTIIDFAGVVIMVMAGFKALNGQITPGDIVLYVTYIRYIIWPLSNLTWLYDDGQEAMRSIEDIFEFLETKPSVQDTKNAENIGKVSGNIEFSNVGFSYREQTKVLDKISFIAKPGESIALVGPSGTGKSTIAKLLIRFYDATEGKILIDGKDIRNITQKSLRKNIGVVQQEAMLFNQSIKKNIGYGTPSAKIKDIERAAKAANIHDFIMGLPEGYNTLVGERGIKLSGGEKQRVAIARALLKNPPILILDEATSHLDSKSEQLVQEAIWRLIEGRTTVIIAHRLATVMKADKIIVIQKGKIIEEDTHEELVAAGGLYEELFKIQSGAMLSED